MFTFTPIIIFALTCSVIFTTALAQQILSGLYIPPMYGYLLPQPYDGNISLNFIDTETKNETVNKLFKSARSASFYYSDPEFLSIAGESLKVLVNISRPTDFAHESGIWVPEQNQIWFVSGAPDHYSILSLDTYAVVTPNGSIQQGLNPTGGDYFDGSVYFAAVGNASIQAPPAVYAIDPVDFSMTTVVNSYFGVPLNSVDDLAWIASNTTSGSTSCTHIDEANLFFTTLDLAPNGETDLSVAVLPNAVYRFTPATQSLRPVISRADILAPNGIAADPTGRYLYVTDTAITAIVGPGSNSSGSTAVFRFDLDKDCNPVNKQLFAIPRSGAADGISVDNYGRVWTAEFNGIVVRNSRGKELGVFNVEQLVDTASAPIRNFALAGDKLVILGGDRLYVVQLAQNVTSPGKRE